jgi:hypothetical protein
MVHEAGRSLTMANPFRFADRPSRPSAFADAAERFDRIINIVKDQQLADTLSGPRRPESEAFVLSPEEAWSRKYMIQCVGPICTIRPTAEGALLLPRFMPAPPAREAVRTREVAPGPSATPPPTPVAAPPAAPMPAAPAKAARPGRAPEPDAIGLLIGKKVRRRGLFGRLFRR